ncbi:hypothetical protein BDF20DRAFT_954260, partial [Mycotypha africana]|uniref:uncharacterized protein n=1 Tax=Mycotypha africana TaxID=64632 RepID=UPI00230078DB
LDCRFVIHVDRRLWNLIAADGQTIHAILICNNCNIYWNRDVNAAKNTFRHL